MHPALRRGLATVVFLLSVVPMVLGKCSFSSGTGKPQPREDRPYCDQGFRRTAGNEKSGTYLCEANRRKAAPTTQRCRKLGFQHIAGDPWRYTCEKRT